MRADLDAAFLHVYGLKRGEAEYVLDSFAVVRKYDERDHGEYLTKRLVLEAYDRMAAANCQRRQGLAAPCRRAGRFRPAPRANELVNTTHTPPTRVA